MNSTNLHFGGEFKSLNLKKRGERFVINAVHYFEKETYCALPMELTNLDVALSTYPHKSVNF